MATVVQAEALVKSTATSATKAFTANVTAGNLVVIACYAFKSTTDAFVAGDITKSAGTATIGTVQLDKTQVGVAATVISAAIWSVPVTASGSLTLQVGGFPGTQDWGFVIFELSGVDTSSGRAVSTNGGDGNSNGNVTSGNVTTTGGGFLVGAMADDSGGAVTITEDGAWTNRGEEENGALFCIGAVASRTVTTGTTDDASWTLGAGWGPWVAAAVAYKDASTTPYAFVQQVEADNAAASGGNEVTSIVSPVFGSNRTAGNLLVCHVWITGQGSPPSCTLSGGGSPTWVQEAVVSAGNNAHLYSFYAMNIPGGVNTAFTATFGAGVNFPSIYVAEYSGFKTTGARLAFTGQGQAMPGTTADLVTSGLLGTLAQQPAGIIGFTLNENSDGNPAAGTGFTGQALVWDYGGGAGSMSGRPEHKRVTATTSVAATFTAASGSTGPFKTAAWAFAEAAAAGGGGGSNLLLKLMTMN